jgi:predicted Ser/Thr protein kinase
MFKGINDAKYFAKGKRSVVYLGEYKGKKVAIKVSQRAKIEAKWLKKLNRFGIGPRLLFCNKDYLVSEFVEGIRILDYFKRYKGKKWVIKDVLRQCRIMDRLKINKLEIMRLS